MFGRRKIERERKRENGRERQRNRERERVEKAPHPLVLGRTPKTADGRVGRRFVLTGNS